MHKRLHKTIKRIVDALLQGWRDSQVKRGSILILMSDIELNPAAFASPKQIMA
jgi:hypothetical protein